MAPQRDSASRPAGLRTPPPPPPSPVPKLRVISHELAKARYSRPLPSSTSAPSATSSAASSSSSSSPSFFSRLRTRLSALPPPVRRTFRVLRALAPIVPIGIFFSEHVFQVMWVRGPSMTPYLNEDWAEMQTRSDMVLVNMWPWGGWPWERKRRLERGMVVTFR